MSITRIELGRALNRLDDELFHLSMVSWSIGDIITATRTWQEWFPSTAGDKGVLDKVCGQVHVAINRLRVAHTDQERDIACGCLMAILDVAMGFVPFVPVEEVA